MSVLITTAVAAAILGSAMVGGIFFAFSNFVMKALARLPSSEGVAAMQSINVVVLNRWFLGVFSGTAAISLILAGIAITGWQQPASPWLLGGALSYVVGTWLVTIATATARGNVPLNKRLAEVEAGEPSAAQVWSGYLERWTTLNSGRALAALVSALLFVSALILQ